MMRREKELLEHDQPRLAYDMESLEEKASVKITYLLNDYSPEQLSSPRYLARLEQSSSPQVI